VLRKGEEGLCRDILCLVRWIGVRHAVGPSENGNEGRSYASGDRSYCWWTPSSDEHSPRGTRSTGSLDAEGRVVGIENPWVMAYGSYPCDDGAGASPNSKGDDVDVGRTLVSLGSCFR
jgi:hypothetical protein